MKVPALLLLCAVTLTQGVDPKSNSLPCNCNEAWQICDANYGNDDILITHLNCDKFYKCTNGRPVVYNCPDGLLYNPYTELCDWSQNVECGDRPISEGDSIDDADCDGDVEIEDGNIDNNDGDNNGSDNGGTDNDGSNNVGGGNCDPSEAPTICAADDSEDVLVAHENCNKFYICNGGRPVALKCPNNLLFNPNTDQCDWPENVDCGDRIIPDPEDSEDGGSDNEDNGGGGNGCGDNGGNDTGCGDNGGGDSGGGENEGGDNDGNDNGGSENEGGDNDGNDNGGENEGGDSGDNDSNDNGDSDNGGSDNGDSGNVPVGGGNCDPSEAPSICAASDSEGILVAHENCNKFYICNGGKPIAIKCPSGLLFNPETDQCDWPDNVNCGDRIIPDADDNEIGGGGDGDGDSGNGDNGGNENEGGNNDGSDNDGSDNGGSDNGSGSCNCNPGEAPEICGNDGSDGVLIAHENCNQFYKCAYGKPITFNCPANLLYNPYTEQCDWPENVECGDRVIPEPEDDNNGSDNGDSDNGGSDNGGSDNGGSDNGGSDNGSGDNGGNDNGSVGGGNCDPSEAPAICAANDSEGVLVAHENCNQFYICNGGKPITMSCPGGLLFNPLTDQCDWPENVDCGDRVIPDPEDNDGESGGGGGNGDGDSGNGDNGGSENEGGDNDGSDNDGSDNGGGTCNCNPGEAPEICGTDGSDGVLIAHENCNQFYKCAYGKPITFNCPANLLYNPYTEQCDWPENVECGDRAIPEPEDDNNGSDNGGGDNGDSDNGGSDNGGSDNGGSDNGGSDNGGSDNGSGDNGGNDNGSVGGGNCDPSEAPAICAANDSEGVLVAHENCNQFYICNGGKPITMSCPGGLLFNPLTDQCDWPENVDCGDRVIPDPEDNDGESGGGGGNGDGDSGNGDNGGSENEGGDNDGSDNDGSDNGGGTCNCNPGEAPEICGTDGSDGELIAHENCNQFYKCAYGKPIPYNCPANLLYNPYTEQCDWPENVECGDRVIPEPEDNNNGSDNGGGDNGDGDNGGSDNGGSDNGGSDNGGSDNGGNDNESIGGGNCDPSEAPAICAENDSEGVLVAHENCNQFYICNGGKPITMSCPGSLLFNPVTDQCDWPENVDCGDRVIPDPEDNENDGNDSGDGDNGGGDNGGGDNGGGDNGGGDNGGGDNGGGDNGEGDNGGSDNGGNGTCNCNPGEAPEICAADGSNGVLVAHENCNQFYKCAEGKPVALICPGNLLYNPYTEQCDWPEKVECGDRVIPEPEDNDNDGSDNDNGGSDNGGTDNGDSDSGNDGTCNCNPGEAPDICEADGSNGVLVAHENCNQFYICSYGKPVALTCPSNLLYNPYTEQCDWPKNVECGDRVIPEPEEDIEDDNDSGNGDNGDSGNDGDQNGDGENDGDNDNNGDSDNDNGNGDNDNGNGDNDDGNGDSEGGDIDNDNGNGDNDNGDDTNESPTSCADSGSNGVLLPHENCNQYYMCSGGLPVEFTCAGDLLFNTLIQQCDWPRSVDCGDRVVPESDGCLCNPRQAPAICSGENSEGLHIAHESCNQFYVCTGGVPVARSCPGVLFYNPRKEVCDWPMKVDCDTRVVPFSSFNKHMESRLTVRV